MAATSESSQLEDYSTRLKAFTQTDAEKNDMIKELIDQLEQAQSMCRQLTFDLDSERDGRRSLQARVEELRALESRRAFVLVLIDADADDYIFREEFLNRNEDGGKDAADEMQARVQDHLRVLKIDTTDIEIMVRAYANLKGLQNACLRNGKLKTGANLRLFAHGFNQRRGLFDFVDVGDWKEGTDNKVRNCLKFFSDNSQCKHIILGACHDSGYAAFLGEFAGEASTRARITLLHGRSIHPRIANLGFQNKLKLESVFAPRQFSVVPVVPSSSAARASAQGISNPAVMSDRLGPIIRDPSTGKRIDRILSVDTDSPYLGVLRQNKMCQWYHLRGRCNGCKQRHVELSLNANEFDCLWFLARHGLCYNVRKGKDCGDPQCIYGHEKGYPKGSGVV